MTGCAVTCFKDKCTQKNQHSGYGALMFRMGHSPKPVSQQKFTSFQLKSSFHRVCVIEIKSACSSPLCCLLSLAVCMSLRVFCFLSADRKKNLPYYFICLSRPLASLVLFPFSQPWKTISYLQLRGI